LKYGKGIETGPNDEYRIEGWWKDEKLNGYGKIYQKGKLVYDGEFKNDLKHGRGNYVHPKDLYNYVGNWRDGRFFGKGTLSYKNGKVETGIFRYGEIFKKN